MAMIGRTIFTVACWTAAGLTLGLVVAGCVLTIGDGRPAAGMCGNSILDPGMILGAFLGFFGGGVLAVFREYRIFS
jgi:hypothetical protein